MESSKEMEKKRVGKREKELQVYKCVWGGEKGVCVCVCKRERVKEREMREGGKET